MFELNDAEAQKTEWSLFYGYSASTSNTRVTTTCVCGWSVAQQLACGLWSAQTINSPNISESKSNAARKNDNVEMRLLMDRFDSTAVRWNCFAGQQHRVYRCANLHTLCCSPAAKLTCRTFRPYGRGVVEGFSRLQNLSLTYSTVEYVKCCVRCCCNAAAVPCVGLKKIGAKTASARRICFLVRSNSHRSNCC